MLFEKQLEEVSRMPPSNLHSDPQFATSSQRLDESAADHEQDDDISFIEKLLSSKESETNPQQLHRALVLSLSKIKKCHIYEKKLSKKLEHLETMVVKKAQTDDSRDASNQLPDENINTSRFGTGSILNEKNLNSSGAQINSSLMENSDLDYKEDSGLQKIDS